MKLDKKQTQQLVVLGVLVLVCIGYISFQFVRPKSMPPPAPTKQAQTRPDAPVGVVGEGEAPAVSPETVPVSDFPDLTSAPARRDPFTPQALPTDLMIEKPTERPKPNPVRAERIVTNPSGKVPVITVGPVNPFKATSPGIVLPAKAQEEKEPEFVLTGVIRGNGNVAIIRSGNSGRYIAREGQTIDGDYKVISVTQEGVVLVHKNRRIQVKLGGVKNAS